MEIQVRKAGKEDIVDLTELLRILFSIEVDFTFHEETHRKGLSLLLEQPEDKAVIFIAEYRKKVIGMVTAQMTVSTAAGGFSAWLEDLVVFPEYQGEGVGRILCETVLDWCREKGCLRVQLLADKDNFPALDFYRKGEWEGSNMIPLKKFL